MPRSTASDLCLLCFVYVPQKDVRLMRINLEKKATILHHKLIRCRLIFGCHFEVSCLKRRHKM